MSDRLIALSAEQGQSPWVDNLKRSYINDGTLQRLVARGIRGVTSNPTIFQKAIAGSNDYDAAFAALIKAGRTIEEAYWELVSDDVRGACAVLRPVNDATQGVDGYVSLEVSPNLADDCPGTATAARKLHETLAIANMMVKIPATAACVPAIQQMIGEGRDINVTLIFSLDRYDDVIGAYLAGLEAQVAGGATDLSGTASVASFFISRVDTEIDRRLDKIGTAPALAVRGKGAVAQAVLAYQLFLQRFSGPRWERLAAFGARPQRPLWASTSTKNPAYPDTMYVDSLIGPNTVNTLPEPTIEAFAERGTLARSIDSVDAIVMAQETMLSLADAGIDMGDVARTLESEGVASFVKSFDELLATLESRSHDLR